jgi:hypothetical protein
MTEQRATLSSPATVTRGDKEPMTLIETEPGQHLTINVVVPVDAGIDRTLGNVKVYHLTQKATVVTPGPDGEPVTFTDVRFVLASNGARIESSPNSYLLTRAVDPANMPTVQHQPGIGWLVTWPDGHQWIVNNLIQASARAGCRSCGGR